MAVPFLRYSLDAAVAADAVPAVSVAFVLAAPTWIVEVVVVVVEVVVEVDKVPSKTALSWRMEQFGLCNEET